jgi:predicted GNAT family acetyltransferase
MTDSDERDADARGNAMPGGDVTVDEMSAASFPASDPPATWTWEVAASASPDASSAEVVVRDNPDRGRYEAHAGSALAGFAEYHVQPGVVTVLHTEVDPAFEGQGVGSELVRRMVEDIRDRDSKVLPICPFARAFLQRHPEYANVVWTP